MYDRILVPTDGSTEGERAVRHAADLAAAHDAAVLGVYVVNTTSYGGLPMETSIEGITQVLENEGKGALDRVAELLSERDVPLERRIVRGTPSKEIVRVAEQDAADLVVMGTHGRGGIDRLLLGSVAERVVRKSPVPVLTVRVGGDSGSVGDAVRDSEAADGADGADEAVPAEPSDEDDLAEESEA